MNEVTLEHIKKACEWAIEARGKGRVPIDGKLREYDQCSWDCGTACCIWGAANILAGNDQDDSLGINKSWGEQSKAHSVAATLMSINDRINIPERVLEVLEKYK